MKVKRTLRSDVLVAASLWLAALHAGAFSTGDRVKAAPSSGNTVNVRNAQLADPPIGQQWSGVHGTITGPSVVGTAGGFTGNWWPIRWDAGDWAGGPDGWCAESVIALASAAGDVAQPSFSTHYYSTDNHLWTRGFAPSSTSPPNPPGCQLGNALGNCTWYAYGRMLELGYSSTELYAVVPPGQADASQWAGNALANSIPVDTVPSVGSIAQSVSPHHVAVVESVNSDGTITVTESSYVSDNPPPNTPWNFLWRRRTVAQSWFQNYIHVRRKPGQTWVFSILSQNFSYPAGSAITIDGLLKDDLNRPIPNATVYSEDPLVRWSGIIGVTATDGSFALHYAGSTTANAGPGIYPVVLVAGKARTTVVVTLQPSGPTPFSANTLQLNLGPVGPSDLLTADTLVFSSRIAGSTLPVADNPLRLDSAMNLAREAGVWLAREGKDYLSNPVNDLALAGTLTCLAPPNPVTIPICGASVEFTVESLGQQMALSTAHLIIDRAPGYTTVEREEARQFADRVALGISAFGLKADGSLLSDLDLFSTGWDTLAAAMETIRLPSGELAGLNLVGVGAGGKETRGVACRLLPATGTQSYTVTAAPSQPAAGSVSGAGAYPAGANVTLVAAANPGYRFVNWTENGAAVGSARQLTFVASASRGLVATFATVPPTCPDLNEPNDSSLTATPLTLGVPAYGYVCTATDVDWFGVNVTTPGVLTFDLAVPAANDYDLELFGPDATYIKGSYRNTGLAENITHQATVTGRYYVRLYGYPAGNGSHSPTVPCTLTAGFTPGSVSSVAAPIISPSGGNFQGAVQVTLDCATAGATVRYTIDGSDPTGGSPAYWAPFTLTTAATVKAKAFMNGYTDSATASASFTVNGPTRITVDSVPSGLKIIVVETGLQYSTPQIFDWTPGTPHRISTPTPQYSSDTAPHMRYSFASWSDGGAQSHDITAPGSPTNYTASFSTQYRFDTTVTPSDGGTISHDPTGPWYDSGKPVSLTARPAKGYTFASWSGVDNSSGNTASVTMSGYRSVTANFQMISLTQVISLFGNLVFGNVEVYSSAQSTLTISNAGNSILTVNNISYPNGFSGNWPSGTIPAGGYQAVAVTFSPTSASNYGGNITVSSDATSGGSTIEVLGAGTATATRVISLSGNLVFGNVAVGSNAQSMLTIANSGNAALTVSNVSYPPGFSGNWSSGSIAAGGVLYLLVTFSPTAATNFGGTVMVHCDRTSGTNTIEASGSGTVPPTRVISLSGNLAFGSVDIGSAAQNILTIANSGNATLTVSNISYPPRFSGSWSSGTIAAGTTQSLLVTFSPTAPTNYGGTVTINSDKTSGVNTIEASGIGTATRVISLSGSLAFGNVPVGSAVQNILTIANSGNATLTVSNISYPPGFSGSWSSGTIAACTTQYLLVMFSPTAATYYGGTVTVYCDKTSGTNTIEVSGNGVTTEFQPALLPQLLQTGLVVSWPTNSLGFALEYTTNLAASAVWTVLATAPSVVNGQNVVTNPIAGRIKLFRLRK